ncbi:MAG: dATP/dGTP diphosphohydrolase domain-containing protein [Candidatus Heimdallarchaeota archaeon]
MNSKDTNPKDAVGTKKVPFSVLSWRAMAEIGNAMLEGARKYGRHNFRIAGVRASVYFDASLRHLTAWWEGEDIDAESGLSHVTKAIAGLMVLRDSMMEENWVDDRPPKVKEGWIQEYNKKAEEIIEKYPNAKSPYTEKNKNEKTN